MQTVLPLEVLTEATVAESAEVATLKAELVDAAAKMAAKDQEIDAIKRRHAAELAAVNAHSLDVDALDEAVESRIALIGAAKSILGAEFDPSGKPDMVIRRLAAKQQLGEAMLAGKDDAYVKIVFDTLVNINHAQTSISAGVQPSGVIAAYNAQIGIHNKLDSAAHGHPDIKHAIHLSFGWVQHGVQGQNQQQSKF